MFKDLWTAQEQSVEQDKEAIQRQINQLDRKTNQLVDRLVDTDSPTLVVAYESRVKEMEEQKLFLTGQLANTGKPVTPFADVFRSAFEFLANPWNIWISDRLEDKGAVMKLVFSDNLTYCRKEGARTAKTTLPLKALGGFFGVEFGVVSRTGFEPVTH